MPGWVAGGGGCNFERLLMAGLWAKIGRAAVMVHFHLGGASCVVVDHYLVQETDPSVRSAVGIVTNIQTGIRVE